MSGQTQISSLSLKNEEGGSSGRGNTGSKRESLSYHRANLNAPRAFESSRDRLPVAPGHACPNTLGSEGSLVPPWDGTAGVPERTGTGRIECCGIEDAEVDGSETSEDRPNARFAGLGESLANGYPLV